MRVKAVITDVSAEGKGPSIVVSRRNPELIKKLFELEVPEIADELVEIVGVAREPGYRSKIAVISHADGVDPVGACVGPRGSRVRMVVSELRGEKIDIIPYNEEPARFVAKALSPARVREVLVDDETKEATVIVPDDQLSLAIGREGQNARLAAKLTGWKVDIKSRDRVLRGRRDRVRGGRGRRRRPLRRGALRRPPLPERRPAELALLRPAAAPGAGPLRDQPGHGALQPQRRGGRRARRPRRRRRRRFRPGRARRVPAPRAGGGRRPTSRAEEAPAEPEAEAPEEPAEEAPAEPAEDAEARRASRPRRPRRRRLRRRRGPAGAGARGAGGGRRAARRGRFAGRAAEEAPSPRTHSDRRRGRAAGEPDEPAQEPAEAQR